MCSSVVCTVFFCRMRAYSSKPVSETVLLQLRNVTSEEDKNILTEDDGGMMQPALLCLRGFVQSSLRMAGNAPSGLQETWTVCRERVAGPPVRSQLMEGMSMSCRQRQRGWAGAGWRWTTVPACRGWGGSVSSGLCSTASCPFPLPVMRFWRKQLPNPSPNLWTPLRSRVCLGFF